MGPTPLGRIIIKRRKLPHYLLNCSVAHHSPLTMPRRPPRPQSDSDVSMAEPSPFPDLVSVPTSPNRHSDWPLIWLCPNHPQWSTNGMSYRKNAYVYVCDTTSEGMERALHLGASVHAPEPGDTGIENFGMLVLSFCLLHAHTSYRFIWAGRRGCSLCSSIHRDRCCRE